MTIIETARQLLKQRGEASLPGFGRFYLKQSAAQYEASSGQLIPPGVEIFYDHHVADEVAALNTLSAAGIPHYRAEQEIQALINLRNQQLSEDKAFKIEGLGTFTNKQDGWSFKGDIMTEASLDFFGLQEVSLDNLKISHGSAIAAQDYTFNNAVLRWFLVIIPIAGLCLAIFAKRDLVFGKKSFPDISVKNSTHRMVPTKPQDIPNQKPVAPAQQNPSGK